MADHPTKVKQRMVRRKKRVHKKISGTAERPRLVVVRSLNHISASLINDVEGRTLMGFVDSKLSDDAFQVPEKIAKKVKMGRKVSLAYRVGLAIADKAKAEGIESIVFDRNGLRYHGRVRALADGARKGGLKF